MSQVEKSGLSADIDALSKLRRRRLIQICIATGLGLLVSLLAARGITIDILVGGVIALIIALVLALKYHTGPSAFVLISSMSVMLFSFALTGAGLVDLAILGYPGLLIFAAILGSVRLFSFVLTVVLAQCFLIAYLNMTGIVIPNSPTVSWMHFIFVVAIFTVTGFCVYILVQDIKRLMLSLQDENQKVEHSYAQIEHLAHHDPLTNLPNRLFAEPLFEESLKKCEENKQKLAILFIDLDNFKPVNDALGHAVGDQLLVKLTQRINSSLTKQQHLIRFGGDEFLVFTPVPIKQGNVDYLAQILIEQCASLFYILHTQVVVSASIGITIAPDHGKDFKHLCRKADIAMYQAKEDGRNTFHYYDNHLDVATDEKFKLLQRIRPALNERQFVLYYQPMVDLKNGDINVLEALLRWPQRDGRFIGPDQFIPIAESGGMINALGSWVLQEACLFCAKQRALGFDDLRVTVNLSVMQFKDGHLKEHIEKALTQAKLPARALELELTESLLIDSADQIQKQLYDISQLGITIAIDDFGTGYSNLGYLRNFNASKLKIDRSFISSVCASKDDESLVTAIIGIAHSLGMQTVAEGIEDEHTLLKLTQLGCDIGQGYYWSKPLPGDEVTKMLSSS